VVLFFRLKFAHRACGVGPSVGVRDDGHESEIFQSTPCVIRDGRAAKLLSKDEARRIAATEPLQIFPQQSECASGDAQGRGGSGALIPNIQ
jgi:hypothetical protein